MEGLEWSSPKIPHGLFLSAGREVSKTSKIIKIGASTAKIQPIQNRRFPLDFKKIQVIIPPNRNFAKVWTFQSWGALLKYRALLSPTAHFLFDRLVFPKADVYVERLEEPLDINIGLRER